ncbi:MAG: SoxR reducing system RseC family protein [Pseudomonadota bacterium]
MSRETLLPEDHRSERIMRRRVRVIAVDRDAVIVEGDRTSACSTCAARTGCAAGALAELVGGSQRLSLPQAFSVSPGEEVIVAMEDRAFLGTALRAYLLPPLALSGVAFLAMVLGISNTVTALLCLPVFALCLLGLRRADRAMQAQPVMWLEPVSSGAV